MDISRLDSALLKSVNLVLQQLRGAGAQVKNLYQGLGWPQMYDALLGRSVAQTLYEINCDSPPKVLPDWEVESHQKRGTVKCTKDSIVTLLLEDPDAGGLLKCSAGFLCKSFESLPVCNANVLDFLLDHEDFISEGLKGKRIFFLGTTYVDRSGPMTFRCVRCLFWDGQKWDCGYQTISILDCFDETDLFAMWV